MKFAIIGFGFMGEMHAQIYQALPGVELAAVVSSQPLAILDQEGLQRFRHNGREA